MHDVSNGPPATVTVSAPTKPNRRERRARNAITGGQTVESKCNACGMVFHRATLRAHRRPDGKTMSDRAFRRHLANVCPKAIVVPIEDPADPAFKGAADTPENTQG